MAPALNACSTASGSFFLFTFNMEPPLESLDNYNSIGQNPQFPTRMATGNACSYGLFRCTGSAGNRLVAWDLDRSLFWKRLDSTTMTKRAATKCCGCYTPCNQTVANLQRNRSARFAKRAARHTSRVFQAPESGSSRWGTGGRRSSYCIAPFAAYAIAMAPDRSPSPRSEGASTISASPRRNHRTCRRFLP
jgi:hypothetical protein